MRVLIAPDSFKGTVDGGVAAARLAAGWRAVRPKDDLRALPLADGGEGTLDVLAAAVPTAQRHWAVVAGPDGAPHRAPWLLLDDATAVVELAVASGLPLLEHPLPLTAHTLGFGQLLAHAARHPGVRKVVGAVGGSASTDGGTGALTALGARFLARSGRPLPLGGAALVELSRIDLSHLVPAPPDGVDLLVDVTAPLLGDDGAARQFGPQKGASATDVEVLEAGLSRLAEVLGVPADVEGTGAAGGTAYGLMASWGARLVPGAATVARLVGLADAVVWADVVVTGEGQLDAQSFRGKVIGHLTQVAGDVPVLACVGRAATPADHRLDDLVTLTDLAGSVDSAMADTAYWLEVAGAELARRRPR